MNPKKIKSEKELNRLTQMLKEFYRLRTEDYGLMDREQSEYVRYADVVRKWTPQKGEVLDLGCGTYRTPLLLHQYGLMTTGCDIFREDQLKEYQKKAGKQGPRMVSYDGNYLPFENESFDTVSTLCVFEHIAPVETILSDMKRVLKPNGRLIIMGPNLSGPHRSVLGIIKILKKGERYWQYRSLFECIAGGIKSLLWVAQLYFRRSRLFVYIYPVIKLGKIYFEQPDDDAIHLNIPLSYKKWFRKNGFRLNQYNQGAGSSAFARFFNYLFPSLATIIQIVAQKIA